MSAPLTGLPHRAQDSPTVPEAEVEKVANQYATFTKFSELTEAQVKVIETTVESVLIRSDEFGALVDSVSGQ
jgi:hypothetical protein